VNDLFQDLSDGKLLMKLLEIISGEQLGRPNRGVLRVQKMENVNRCLQFLATKVWLLCVVFVVCICCAISNNHCAVSLLTYSIWTLYKIWHL